MDNSFSGCSGLIALNLSNLNFEKLNSADELLQLFDNLKYIDLKNTFLAENILKLFAEQLSNNTNLIPCHNNDILKQYEVPSICCSFDLELGRCEKTNNYIIVNFGQNYLKFYKIYMEGLAFEYEKGFMDKNNQRKSISFINYKNLTYRIDSPLSFDVAEEEEVEDQFIELHFLELITNLSSFFSILSENEDDFSFEPIYSLDFSYFDSSLIEDTSSMFENNMFIKEINFTNFNTSHIKNMENMFKDCTNLISLDLSNFDTSSVTSMASMFKDCYFLRYLDLSNFNTSSVTSMYGMFKNCLYLEYLDISNFVMNSEINYSDMFQHLSSLKYISLINIHVDADINEVFSSFIVDNKDDNEDQKELLVCQNKTYIPNSTNFCCEKNNNSLFCKTENYITVKYKDETSYPCGFAIENECLQANQVYGIPMAFINKMNNKDDDDSYDFEPHLTYSNRKYISFINIRNSTYMGFTTPIKIEKNDNLEIHFIHPPSELNSFFDNSFFDSLFGEEEQLGEEEEFLINYFGDNNI